MSSSPRQPGSWHWLSDHEAHWRPKSYWQAGTDVTVDLAAGGTSTVTVTSDTPVSETDVATALDEAGDYHLATV